MTDEHLKLQEEHNKAHEDTVRLLHETDEVLKNVQEIISQSRLRLKNATTKYEERLHGPTTTGHH